MVVDGMQVEVAGQGPALVLVHGLGGTGNVWQPQMSLASRFSVLRPDLPGAGRSAVPASASIERFVASLIALLDAQKIERAHFVGHSFGALVLQHLAAAHPDRVDKLALVGAVRAPADANRQGPRDRAAKVRSEGMVSIADAVANAATAPDTRQRKPAVMTLVREFLMRQNAEGYALTCEALSHAVDAPFSRIRAQTLFITGEDDAVAPLAMVRKLAEELPSARVESIAACGHWSPIEQPERVTAALESFL
jgi:pimeloyl-ACP methyl ester carboxylesterase